MSKWFWGFFFGIICLGEHNRAQKPSHVASVRREAPPHVTTMQRGVAFLARRAGRRLSNQVSTTPGGLLCAPAIGGAHPNNCSCCAATAGGRGYGTATNRGVIFMGPNDVQVRATTNDETSKSKRGAPAVLVAFCISDENFFAFFALLTIWRNLCKQNR